MAEGKLYYGIGEVSQMLGVNSSLLRYWETEFDCIKPMKNKKGDRSYTAKDIDLLRRIIFLTRDCGYTLEGAREQLKSKGDDSNRQEIVRSLQEVRAFLETLKESLD